jgi:hypothetical protein
VATAFEFAMVSFPLVLLPAVEATLQDRQPHRDHDTLHHGVHDRGDLADYPLRIE